MVEVLVADRRAFCHAGPRSLRAISGAEPHGTGRSTAARDDDRVAEDRPAWALRLERSEHDDELSLHDVEHVGNRIDTQDVVAEREVRHRAQWELELALGVGRDR